MAEVSMIGIDLGTTYSCVGIYRNGRVEIIPNDQGNRKTPSFVAFTETERLIGEAAKSQASRNPSNTIFDVKRIIGRSFADPSLQSDMKNWPFKVVNDGGKPKILVKYKNENISFFPEEILSMILMKMKEIAEVYLGKPISDAVISVPSNFNSSQKQAVIVAGTIAGLNFKRITIEPTAAAVASDLNPKEDISNVLVFDLGGGTFDVSVICIEHGIYEVLSTSGDTNLGGVDFDTRTVNHFVQEFSKKHKKDLSTSKRAISRLRSACEQAKIIMSANNEASIEIELLFEGIDFFSKITRNQFEKLNADLFQSTLEHVEKALNDARLDKAKIREVILVGGSTRIPIIQKMLNDFFDGKELCKNINLDEAVAYGATLHSAILMNKEKHLLLLDVVPFPLVVEIRGEKTCLIKKNSSLPAKATETFTLNSEDKGSVIEVFEDNNAAADDKLIIPVPPGVLEIEISIDINADGIWEVFAIDKKSEEKKSITVIDKCQLTKEEIVKMQKTAAQLKVDYDKMRDLTAAKNSLESYAFNIKSVIEDERLKDRITDFICDVSNKVNDTLNWLDNNDFAESRELEEKLEELKQCCHINLATLF